MFPASFKVMLMFEVPGETVVMDGKPAPMTIQKEYTLSLSEKANLRRDLHSWRGREFTAKELDGFAVETVCGAPCMLSVIHKTNQKNKTYANIGSISSLPKGVQCPPLWHKAVKYEIEQGADAVFQSLPEWIQEKIKRCEEWTRTTDSPAGQSEEPEPEVEPESTSGDSVPF